MKNYQLTSILLLFVASLQTHATGLFLQGGIHTGGDTLVSGTLSTGDTENVNAGELISASIGLHTDLSETLHGRASIGIKADNVNASNGDVEFQRFPVDLLLMYRSEAWMFGGGITIHRSPELTVETTLVNVAPGTYEYEDARGFILALDYSQQGTYKDSLYVGVRATFIDYETHLGTTDGNSIGLVLGYLFD